MILTYTERDTASVLWRLITHPLTGETMWIVHARHDEEPRP